MSLFVWGPPLLGQEEKLRLVLLPRFAAVSDVLPTLLSLGRSLETPFAFLILFGFVLAGRVEIGEASFLPCVILAQGLRTATCGPEMGVGSAWGSPGPRPHVNINLWQNGPCSPPPSVWHT